MYFTVAVDGASHVWREPFPSGALEQITSGPATARGLAMSPDGRSLVSASGANKVRFVTADLSRLLAAATP